MMAVSLPEFLEARLAEDEAVAAACPAAVVTSGLPESVTEHLANYSPPRALAEVAAKRQIVELLSKWPIVPGLEFACRALASVYREHPDFREGWRL